MSEDGDELTRRRGRPPKPRKPPKYAGRPPPAPGSVRHTQKLRENETKSALYHLTARELKFVQCLAMGMSGVDAVKAAGWRVDGERGKVRAWRLQKQPLIRAAIYQLMCQSFDKASIEVTQWLREVATMAFMPPEMLEGKPRWTDKNNALKMVGEYQKLLEKTAPTTKEVNIINLITQSATPKTVNTIETQVSEPVASK